MTDATPAQDILAMHAAMSPDKVAVVDEDGEARTYAQLNARVNRGAHALTALGVVAGDRCLHLHHNRVEAFELGHALRKLQAVTTPVNWRLVPDELAYLVTDSRPAVVVAGPEFAPVLDAARERVDPGLEGSCRWVLFGADSPRGWLSWEALLDVATETEPPPPPGISGPTMVYTAGTTGRPKGAYRAKGADIGIIFQYLQEFGLRSEDVHLLAGPGYHSAPAVFAGLQAIIGATVVVEHRFDPLRALALIAKHRVTTTFMAPTLVRRILDLPESVRAAHDVSTLRALIVAAAPFPADLKRRAQAYFGDCIYEFYGASETGVVSVMKPDELLVRPDSCGRILDGVEVRLLDEEGADVAPGEPGELWTRSAGMLGEYWGRGEETERSRRDGFFSVGDIARLDADGFLVICDRRIDMVISGGVNIYPAEIEGILAEHPDVQDVAVIGVPDEEWGETLLAIAQPRPGATVDAAELLALTDGRLAPYKRPRAVEFVEEFPRDAAGKLLKRVLRERYWADAGRSV